MKHILVYGMTNNPGGIETYLHYLFQRIHGKSVLLDFVSDFPQISDGESLTERGAQLYFIPAKSKDLLNHLRKMWKILQQHKEYESVYFNILDAGAVVTMIPVILAGRKVIVHSHNNNTEKIKLHAICKPLLNLIIKERIACSYEAAEYMFGRAAEKAMIVPNVIDSKRFQFSEVMREAKRKELGINNQQPCICHVGRISQQKNPLRLIDIFASIHRMCPDAKLISVGDGEMRGQFHAYIVQKGLGDSVICLGARDDVAEIYSAADVFLLPSLYEGLGIVVLEAQAAGLPCVISDCVPACVNVTECVSRVSLSESNETWAKIVLSKLQHGRKSRINAIVLAGYDISCCEEYDRKLIDMF